MKRENLKVHKPTIWIFLGIVFLFVVITLIALNNSAKRHNRNLMPSQQNVESKQQVEQ